MNEIMFRNSTLTDIDVSKRQIDLIAVPWDEEANVLWHGELWREVFRRGAFEGIEARANQVRVNREHIKGSTVGKIIGFDSQHNSGLWARVQVVKGAVGDEVLNLAEDDMISGSIGYKAQKSSDVRVDKPNRLRTVLNAWLDHLGMVEDPAFSKAQVLAVREDQSELLVADGPLPDTPILDAYMNDPVLLWARDRCAS